MPWAESQSASFTARHDSGDADVAAAVLDELERFRARLDERFATTPREVTVIIHARALQLAVAHPWLPLARALAAPAARRYLGGWFASGEIHVLGPAALERRASGLPESREALRLSPLHEYAHLVVGANNRRLPPPFTPRGLVAYLRWTWLCEGAATHLAGQTRLLRPAIARRLHDGPRPALPPARRDAQLLGCTVFGLLEETAGADAATELATSDNAQGPERSLERAFGRRLPAVARDWHDYLEDLTAAAA